MKWGHECQVNGLEASVFLIPEERAKNGRERIVPLNAIARSIIDSRRGQGEYVFELEGQAAEPNEQQGLAQGPGSGRAQRGACPRLAAFGKRLRAAGVSLEDRQDLLGHHAGRITSHCSQAEIANLIECVELLCEDKKKSELTLIRCA